jgi:outer membrane protein
MKGPRFFLLLFVSIGVTAVASAAGQALTLAEAREMAIKSHPRITIAQLRSLVAREGVTQARAGYFPTVAANATAIWSGEAVTRIASGQLSNSQIFDHTGIGATMSFLVTDFGRTANLNEAAKKRARAAEADVLASRAQLLLQVNAAYLDVLKARAVKEVAEKTLSLRQAVFARTQALGQNQLRSELDVRLAQVNVDEARLLIDSAEKDLQAAATILGNLIGDNTFAVDRQLEIPPAPAELPKDFSPLTALALQQRPELARYRAEADAARATARAAKDARLPTISVMASAGYIPLDYPQFDTKYAAGGINLNLPLFAGGLYRSRQHEAELQASAAEAAWQDTVNTITREVRLAWLEAVHAQERIGLTASLAENANAAQSLARARFEQGLSSTVELMQAELAQTSADIAKSTADYAYRVRREILDYQTGALR